MTAGPGFLLLPSALPLDEIDDLERGGCSHENQSDSKDGDDLLSERFAFLHHINSTCTSQSFGSQTSLY